jgi:hypothetical protein
MGWVAAACSRMSRFRINGIPSHVFIIFICGLILMMCQDMQLRDSKAYGKPPKALTVTQLMATAAMNNYVTVTGKIAPDVQIRSSGNGDNYVFVPMYDPATMRAVLIETQTTIPLGANSTTTVTGMLRQVPSDLYSHLKDSSFQVGPYQIDTAYLIDNNDGPVNPQMFYLTVVLCGIPLILLAISVGLKHIIFEKTNSGLRRPLATDGAFDPASIDMRFTGRLALTPKVKQRFLNMPISLVNLKSGEMAFASRINASVKTEYGSTINREGVWVAVVQNGSLRIGVEGKLYLGKSIRPALKVAFTDIALPKAQSVSIVLTFGSEEEREQARELLTKTNQQAANNPASV